MGPVNSPYQTGVALNADSPSCWPVHVEALLSALSLTHLPSFAHPLSLELVASYTMTLPPTCGFG